MKNNEKISKLIKKGLSVKTVSNLDESQINTLYNKLYLFEQVTEVPNKKTYKIGPKGGKVGNVTVSQDPNTKEVMVTAEEQEMREEDEINFDPNKEIETQDPHQVGPGSDDGFGDETDDGMGIFEARKKRKSKKVNPWAICTSQLGKEFKTTERHLWNTKQKNKYERCVRDVKKTLKENKNPVTLFLENQIMKIVERNLPPRITKKDLMNYLSEGTTTAPSKPKTNPKVRPTEKPKVRPSHPGKNPNPGEKTIPKAGETKENTTTAPSKPKTSPKTTPTEKPKVRPSHPGKNPNPGEKTTPKAINPEKAKEEIINTIIKILSK